MDKEQVQEVVKIINEANSGNWLPIAVVGSLFGIFDPISGLDSHCPILGNASGQYIAGGDKNRA